MYLTENTPEAQEMREQVMRLLSSDTTENIELALQLISGGGYCFDFAKTCGSANITQHLVSLGYLTKNLHIDLERYTSCSNNVRMFLVSYHKLWHSLFSPNGIRFSADVSYLETSGWITDLCHLILRNKVTEVEVFITFDYSLGSRGAKKTLWQFLQNNKELADLSYAISRNARVKKHLFIIWFSRRRVNKRLAHKEQSCLFA